MDLNNNFVDTYAADSFEKEAKLLVARPLGLTHSSEEYRNKLVEHMNLAKDRIIAEAKNTVDIDKEIGILLRENVKLFATENDNHAKYEHLDKIMAVVLRVKQYVDQSNRTINAQSFTEESAETCAVKLGRVQRLETMSNDKTLSIDEKLNTIRDYVRETTFEKDILQSKTYDAFTFSYLRHCLAKLLELVGLYTPEPKKCYKQLLECVKPQSLAPAQLTARFGLFSNTPDAVSDAPQYTPGFSH